MKEAISPELYTKAYLRLEELLPKTQDVSPENDPLVVNWGSI